MITKRTLTLKNTETIDLSEEPMSKTKKKAYRNSNDYRLSTMMKSNVNLINKKIDLSETKITFFTKFGVWLEERTQMVDKMPDLFDNQAFNKGVILLNAFEKAKLLMRGFTKTDRRFVDLVGNFIMAYALDDGENTDKIQKVIDGILLKNFPWD